jgi:signal transduction histidine kinase
LALAAAGDPATRVVAIAPQYALGEEEERLRNGLLIASLPILVFAGFAGWVLARRSLAPIDRMTAVAAEIARSGRLSTRLGLQSSDDELGRLARTFDTMLAQLDAAFTRERAFVGDVSHELRNAIGTIAAEGELALSRPRDEYTYQAALATIIARARRIAATIDDLLLLARADAGILETTQRGELDEIASQACADLQKREPDALPIGLELSEHALVVAGSPQLLARLIENLVSNARRAAKTSVRVRIREHEQRAIVTVEDDGPGIPAGEHDAIFRRFYRGSAQYAGTGLGLPISAAIARSYGGTIRVDNGPAGGARFTLELPLVASRDGDASCSATASGGSSACPAPPQGSAGAPRSPSPVAADRASTPGGGSA